MAQYKDGTVEVTNSDGTVLGTGTLFASNVRVGDIFSVLGSGILYQVASITDDTHLELTANYAGESASGLDYLVATSFTPNYAIPLVSGGDSNWPDILAKGLTRIDEAIFAAAGGRIDVTRFASLAAAVADASTLGKTIVLAAGTHAVDADLTVAGRSIEVASGAAIAVAADKVLTFGAGASVIAGDWTVFTGTGTVAGLAVARLAWFGGSAAADGAVNAASLQSSMNAVAANGTWSAAPGNYAITGTVARTGGIYIEASGVTLLPTTAVPALTLVGTAAASATTTASAVINVCQDHVTVSSAAGMAVGQLLELQSPTAWYYDDRGTLFKGELHLIDRISGSDVYFSDITYDTYDAPTEVVTVKAYAPGAFTVRGLQVVYAANSSVTNGISISYGYGVILTDVRVVNAAQSGIGIIKSVGVRIRGGGADGANNTTNGYGISVASSYGIQVDDISGRRNKRLIDFTGAPYPSRVAIVSASTADGGGLDDTGALLNLESGCSGFGTHGPAELITFVNNRTSNVYSPFYIRGGNIHIVNNTHVGGCSGAFVSYQYGANLTVIGNRTELLVSDRTDYTTPPAVSFRPDRFLYVSVNVSASSKIVVKNNSAAVVNRFIYSGRDLSGLDVQDNSIEFRAANEGDAVAIYTSDSKSLTSSTIRNNHVVKVQGGVVHNLLTTTCDVSGNQIDGVGPDVAFRRSSAMRIEAAAKPDSGTNAKGDYAFNWYPYSYTPRGWICTASGTPGTWSAVGPAFGTTVQRPALDANDASFLYFDTTIAQPIVWGGAAWVVGVIVSGNVTQANLATLTGGGTTTLHSHTALRYYVPLGATPAASAQNMLTVLAALKTAITTASVSQDWAGVGKGAITLTANEVGVGGNYIRVVLLDDTPGDITLTRTGDVTVITCGVAPLATTVTQLVGYLNGNAEVSAVITPAITRAGTVGLFTTSLLLQLAGGISGTLVLEPGQYLATANANGTPWCTLDTSGICITTADPFSPNRTVITYPYHETGGPLFLQSAPSISLIGFTMDTDQGGDNATQYAIKFAANLNNSRSRYVNLNGCRTYVPNDLYGTWINCIGPDYAWRVGEDEAAGKLAATMIDCAGGRASFAGDGSVAGTNDMTGVFIRCTGGLESFCGCAVQGGHLSGTFIDCIGDDRSFGMGCTIKATARIYRCRGGNNAFAGTINPSTAAGHIEAGAIIEDSFSAGGASFGMGNAACSNAGTMRNCWLAGLPLQSVSGVLKYGATELTGTWTGASFAPATGT